MKKYYKLRRKDELIITKGKQNLSEFVNQFEEFITFDEEIDDVMMDGYKEFIKNLLHIQNIISTIDDKMFNKCEPKDVEVMNYLNDMMDDLITKGWQKNDKD